MTIADQLRQEGLVEGKQQGFIEGKLEVAKKLLNQGSDVNTITELTDLPRKKIEELKKQVIN